VGNPTVREQSADFSGLKFGKSAGFAEVSVKKCGNEGFKPLKKCGR